MVPFFEQLFRNNNCFQFSTECMDEMDEASCAKVVKKEQCEKKRNQCMKSCGMCDYEPATTKSGEDTTEKGGIALK